MYKVTIHEAKTHLSRLIREVLEGEEVIIAKGKTPVVRLVPANNYNKPKFGSAKGMIKMADDFDEPLDDFKEYME